MKNLDANVDGTAALVAAGRPALGLLAVATGLVAVLRARRWVYSALNYGRSRLGLNLRNHLGAVLRKGWGYRGHWKRRNLHCGLTSMNSKQFSHMRNEHLVNLNGFKMFLNNRFQLANFAGFFTVEVRS